LTLNDEAYPLARKIIKLYPALTLARTKEGQDSGKGLLTKVVMKIENVISARTGKGIKLVVGKSKVLMPILYLGDGSLEIN